MMDFLKYAILTDGEPSVVISLEIWMLKLLVDNLALTPIRLLPNLHLAMEFLSCLGMCNAEVPKKDSWTVCTMDLETTAVFILQMLVLSVPQQEVSCPPCVCCFNRKLAKL